MDPPTHPPFPLGPDLVILIQTADQGRHEDIKTGASQNRASEDNMEEFNKGLQKLLVTGCSWCEEKGTTRVRRGEEWTDLHNLPVIAQKIYQLANYEKGDLRVSHSICPECYETAMRQIDAGTPEKTQNSPPDATYQH